MGRRRAIHLGLLVVSVTLGALGVYGMQPEISGQFHDDALYLAVAKSLAEGDGYRIGSLPTTPPQTKYPPIYSHILSWIWRLSPSFPENLVWMKALSALFLAAIAFLSGIFYLRYVGRAVWEAVAVGFLVGANMLVFPFTDYTSSELPFLLACIGCLVIVRPRGPASARLGHAVLLGAVCGFAVLLRSAAVPLVVAGVAYFAVDRRWRELATFSLVVALVASPWLVFKLGNAAGISTNPLLQYYVAYEPSVPQIALTDPGKAIEVALTNVYYVWTAFEAALLLGYVPSMRIFLYPLVIWGLWLLLKPPVRFLQVFAALYLILIVLWPWHPGRYAMPLAALLPFALVLGTRAAVETLGAKVGRVFDRRLFQGLVGLPLAAFILLSCAWLAAFVRKEPDSVRMAFAARLDYSWDGFEETFAWVRENTETDAVLATPYDPMYYLFTGRRGVRPWIHRPATYFYPRSDPEPVLGPAPAVRDALDELGVRYLIIDPLDGYSEREAAKRLFDELLDEYSGEKYAEPARLLFESSDSRHRVYRLPGR